MSESCLSYDSWLMWITSNTKTAEKSKSLWRWFVLVNGCIMLIGSYYCFDIPAALKTQIDDYTSENPSYETYFSLFYSLYALPNIILPFFGGYFVDKIGVRLCLLVFAALVTAGQVIFTIGLSSKSWSIMFIGRFVFGLGGESLVVANSALLADWFKDKELAFSFGLVLAVARLGSVFNNILSPFLTNSVGIIFAMWFGVLLCLGSMMSIIITLPVDSAFDLKLDKLRQPFISNDLKVSNITMGDDEGVIVLDSENDVSNIDSRCSWLDIGAKKILMEMFSLNFVFWLLVILCLIVYGCVLPFNNVASSLLLERNYFMSPPKSCHLLYENSCQSDVNIPVECPSGKYYQPPLPMNITLSTGQYYPGQVTDTDVDCTQSAWADECTVQYCSRLAAGEEQAALIMSIPYIISAVMSPILGIYVDKYGLRALIASMSPVLLIIVHLLLGLTSISPIGPLIGQGFAYTGFAAVLWPAIPLIVEESLTGLAFGIVTSALNFACTAIPLLVAFIYTASDNHYIPNVELLFVALGFVGSLVGIYLNYHDYYYIDSILNKGAEDLASSGHEDFKSKGGKDGYFSVSLGPGDIKLAINDSSNNAIDAQAVVNALAHADKEIYLDDLDSKYDTEGECDRLDDLKSIGRMKNRITNVNNRDRAMSLSDSTGRSTRNRSRNLSFTAHERIHQGGGY